VSKDVSRVILLMLRAVFVERELDVWLKTVKSVWMKILLFVRDAGMVFIC
jgi:hypothetical protein